MNKLPPIILICMTLTGCFQKKSVTVILDYAESLVDNHPDSALNVLQTIPDTTRLGNERNHARYYLLLTKAQYKSYKETTIDSLLPYSMAYFSREGDKKKLSETYYYQAMVCIERGQNEASIDWLKKGEQIARDTRDDFLLSKFYESLSQANFSIQYFSKMLEYAKLFLEVSERQKDTACIFRAYGKIGTAYGNMGQQDKAEEYTKKGLDMTRSNQIAPADVAMALANLGCTYLKCQKDKEAERVLLKSINIHPSCFAYGLLAAAYKEEGQPNKAIALWEKALKTNGTQLRIGILSDMEQFYCGRQDFKTAYQLLQESTRVKDSLYEHSEQATLAELQLKYDNQVAINKEEQMRSRLLRMSLITIIGGIIATLLASFFYRHKKRAYLSIIHQEKDKANKAELHIGILRQKAKEKDIRIKELQREAKEKEGRIKELQQAITDSKAYSKLHLRHGKHIYESILQGKSFSEKGSSEEEDLVTYYSLIEMDKFEDWEQTYKNLTTHMFAYFILRDMGKTNKDIAYIFNVDEGSVRVLKSRILHKREQRG